MIPVEVRLRSLRGPERVFRYRMVEDELFTPLLGYVSLLSILRGHERAFGAATLRVDARLALAGGREVRVQDVVAAEQPAQEAAGILASPLALLVGNDFEKVSVEKLSVEVDAEEELREATVTRAWVDAPEPLRPGTTVPVKVQLRTHRGETITRELPLALPASAPGGTYSLMVGSAAVMDAVEQREMRQAFAPRDLPALVQALNKLRSGDRVYARLTPPGRRRRRRRRVPAGASRLRSLRAQLLRPGDERRPAREHPRVAGGRADRLRGLGGSPGRRRRPALNRQGRPPRRWSAEPPRPFRSCAFSPWSLDFTRRARRSGGSRARARSSMAT